MNLYEINAELFDLIDPRTGEIRDFDAWEALSLAREEKAENTALWVKDLEAEAKAIDDEIKKLAERRDSAKRKASRLREYLQTALAGEKFKTARCAISYRKTEAVEITDEVSAINWLMKNGDEALTYRMPTISKTAVKELIKAGQTVPGAELVERQAMSIK